MIPKPDRPRNIKALAVELLMVNFAGIQSAFNLFKVPGVVLHAAGGRAMAMTRSPIVKVPGTEYRGISKHGVEVPMVTVDGLHTMFALPPVVDLLSIDTEGHDAHVLAGAMHGIKEKRYRIIEFEYHGVGAWRHISLNDTVQTMLSNGYECYWQGMEEGVCVVRSELRLRVQTMV